MTDVDDRDATAQQRERVVGALWAYASGQSELGRVFARHSGLHTTDAAALVEILRAEQRGRPLSPAHLARLIGVTTGATSILLNRLEDAGHVTRVRGHADRRAVTLHSAAAVHATSEAFFGPLHARFDEIMSGYSSEQLALVEGFVDAMRRAVDSYPGPEGSTS